MSKTQAKSPAKVPKYKLTYFNVRGRAEHTRMLFAAAGVEFEDCRIKKEDWAKLKEEVPQKTLPILDIDGKTRLTQSYAIARYVAREYGFYGKTNLEAAHIDSLLDTILDIFQAAIPGFMEKDETKKAELRKKLESEDVPKYFGFIDTAIGKFGKDGYAVPSGLTIADIILFNVTDFLRLQEHAAKYSNIAKSRKHVQEHPKLKKYLAERPDSEF